MRSILHSLVLAPIVLAAAALAPNTASAETTVNVPFSFSVDGNICPAGQYTVTRDALKNTVYLHSQKAPVGFQWILTAGDDNRQASRITLHFNQNDEKFTLQTVEYGRMTTYGLDHKSKHSTRQLERVVEGQ